MIGFGRVTLQGEDGKRKFILRNGEETKTLYDAGDFNFSRGQFPIYDENNKVVEYMDLMGNFSDSKTKLASSIYNYIISETYMPITSMVYRYGLLKFPSKFLTDEDVKNFIIQEEKVRYKVLKTHNISLIEKLEYKIHSSKCLHAKFKKAKRLLKEQQTQENEYENEI